MPSLIHKFVLSIIRRTGTPQVEQAIRSGEVYRDELSSHLKSKFNISIHTFKSYSIFTYGTPINGEPIIYFLHGGGFRIGMSNLHYSPLGLMHKISKKTLIAPDFPLPPEANAQGVIEYSVSHLTHIMTSFPNSPLILAGDSAGALMSLSCIRNLDAQLRARVNGIFLLFGAFNLTRKPQDFVFHKEEVLLKPEIMQSFPRHWAGSLALDHPIISPIFGSFEDLPPLYIYSADKDPLYIDSCELAIKLDQNKNAYSHIVFEDYGHDIILFPTPDGRKALRRVTEDINKVFDASV